MMSPDVLHICHPRLDTDDPNPLGYPGCCVEAFRAYSERYQNGEEGQRPTIHSYGPCDACLARAPMEQLWQEIVDRRGYGCIQAMEHLVTHVEPDVMWFASCDECAAALPRSDGDWT